MHRTSVLPHAMDDGDVQGQLDDEGAAYVLHDPVSGDVIAPVTDGPHGDREPIDLSRLSGNAAFHEIITRLREADLCADCGKTRAVMNIGGWRREVFERVSPATHCACVGGPAYTGIGSTAS